MKVFCPIAGIILVGVGGGGFLYGASFLKDMVFHNRSMLWHAGMLHWWILTVVSLAGIVPGVGLIRGKAWGRKFALIGYGLWIAATAYFNFFFYLVTLYVGNDSRVTDAWFSTTNVMIYLSGSSKWVLPVFIFVIPIFFFIVLLCSSGKDGKN